MKNSKKRMLNKNRFNKANVETKSNLSNFNLDNTLKTITKVNKFIGFINKLNGFYYLIAHHNDIIDKFRMFLENIPQ